jgi:hypothetical protein
MVGQIGSLTQNYYRPAEVRTGSGQQALAGVEAVAPIPQEGVVSESPVDQLISAYSVDPGRRQLPEWTEALSDRALKKMGLLDCQTCESRKYQDGSSDPGVSYKSATQISPDEAAVKVRAHEQEHVVRNQAKAERKGKEVLFQTVCLQSAVCPECGRVYISGGETRTVTKGKANEEFRPGSNLDTKM